LISQSRGLGDVYKRQYWPCWRNPRRIGKTGCCQSPSCSSWIWPWYCPTLTSFTSWSEIKMSEIDPVAYGVLTAKVENLEKKLDKLESSIEELIALVNKGKGGVWMGMAIVSGISSIIGFVSHNFFNRG
jgi:hypothetical protein